MERVSADDLQQALQDDDRFPRMTRWFDPRLLGKLLLGVVVSDLFGQYADRRLVMAALDHADKQELRDRTRLDIPPDADGAVWFDYVSDLGDGFDATYAVAYLLAQETLAVDGGPNGPLRLPRGRLLVMGGDQVYPTASRDEYDRRLRRPYWLAFPDRTDAADRPPLYMIPGNHDWYDGLVSFLSMFCRAKPTSVGRWRTPQRRSYFALRLTADWWLWAIDIALTENMDQPQADYFVAIGEAMPQGAKIVLCSAQPGWYDADAKAAAFRSLHYAAQLADNAGKDFRIVAALSGDTHHYARYASAFGTQFVTSGGGGAFLSGTHGLKDRIPIDWLKARNQTLTLEARYPTPEKSRGLLARNFLFPLLNPEFAALLGGVYALLAVWLAAVPRYAVGIAVFGVLAAGFLVYARYQERAKIAAASPDPDEEPDKIERELKKSRATVRALAPALAHAGVHFIALVGLSWAFATLNARLFGVAPGGWPAFLLFLAEMAAIGGAVAGFIFGVHLWATCRFLNMNHTDAFSAMRLDRYRHFLRLRIKGDELTIYPVGLDRVPKRREWTVNPDAGRPPVGSWLLPPDDVRPHLIEPPIAIRAATVGAVTAAVKPDALTGADSGSAVAPTEPPPLSRMGEGQG